MYGLIGWPNDWPNCQHLNSLSFCSSQWLGSNVRVKFLEGEKHTLQALERLHELQDGENNALHYHSIHQSCYSKGKDLVINCDEVIIIDN